MLNKSRVILVCAALWLVANPALAEYVSFKVARDQANGFSTKLKANDGHTYWVKSALLERPTYARSAKMRITIQKDGESVLDEKLSGEYHLLGFDTKRATLHALYLGQHGAESMILNVVAFNQKTPKGRVLGPEGAFQFASLSPSGAYCILVDSSVKAVNVRTGVVETYLADAFKGVEADPTRQLASGATVGGSMSLSGEFMEMQWHTPGSGILVIRDVTGTKVREIALDLKAKQR